MTNKSKAGTRRISTKRPPARGLGASTTRTETAVARKLDRQEVEQLLCEEQLRRAQESLGESAIALRLSLRSDEWTHLTAMAHDGTTVENVVEALIRKGIAVETVETEVSIALRHLGGSATHEAAVEALPSNVSLRATLRAKKLGLGVEEYLRRLVFTDLAFDILPPEMQTGQAA